MSKLDRQGVRTAQDLEQKYNLSAIRKTGLSVEQQKMLLSNVEQAVAQYTKATNDKLANLENELGEKANTGEWEANKILGTDADGNIVEKDIPASGGLDILAIYPVGSVYTTLSTDNPSALFGGTWELIAEGQLVVGLVSETEKQEVFQTEDNCFMWKRIA